MKLFKCKKMTTPRRAAWLAMGLLCLLPVFVLGQSLYLDQPTLRRARAYEPLLQNIARQHGVDAYLLWVIAYLESRFRPQAVSAQGARGLMQLMPATAARWGVQNPHDPRQAVTGAARYVQFLGQRFGGRLDLTLAAYNAGETVVEAYRSGRRVRVGHKLINPTKLRTSGVPPYRETRAYVGQGLALWQQLANGKATSVRRPVAAASEDPISPQKSIFYATTPAEASPAQLSTPMARSITYVRR